jgi:hypothetical protein
MIVQKSNYDYYYYRNKKKKKKKNTVFVCLIRWEAYAMTTDGATPTSFSGFSFFLGMAGCLAEYKSCLFFVFYRLIF